MKVLVVGNYVNNRQESMQRFAELMHQGLAAAGHQVRLVRPPVLLGRLRRGETGLAKWIGYIDRFALYPGLLRRQARWADVVHICDQANAVYIPHLRRPHVLTCHDMLAIRAACGEIRESRVGWSGRLYQRWILRNLHKAQMVVCVSRQTYDDARRIADLPHDCVTVVSNALNYPYHPMTSEDALSHLSTLGLEPRRLFFLHVGGNNWYKNRLGVLRIFAELVNTPAFKAHGLIMAGQPWTAEMRQLARSLHLEDRVLELVAVSNEQLCALYSTAEALLFPSFYEGFGWPIAEAQACGCPVVTSNRPPMTEVGGGAAIYIDPMQFTSASKTIVTALTARERLRVAGLANAGRFTTETMIAGYLAAYCRARGAFHSNPAFPQNRHTTASGRSQTVDS